MEAAGGRKPSPEELEEAYRLASEKARELPADADAQLLAGQAAEALGRRLEAYTAYFRAANLDPAKAFLLPKLRTLAASPEEKAQVARISRRPTSFRAAIGGAFAYPLRGKGLALLVMGALLVWFLRLLGGRGGFSTVSAFPAAFATAFLCMFYVDICSSTAMGGEDLPDWPDITHFQEFIVDWAKLALPGIVSFLPILLVMFLFFMGILGGPSAADSFPEERPTTAVEDDDDDDAPARTPAPVKAAPAGTATGPGGLWLAAGAAWALLGMTYLPIAILGNVMFGNPWACLQVPYLLRSARSSFRDYALCLAVFYGLGFLITGLETAARLPGLFLVGGILPVFAEIYGASVLMRILGLFYLTNRARLGWMPVSV